MVDLTVTAHAFGPMLFREARPFSASGDESRATSLETPSPTTVAGLIRTTLGNVAGLDWSKHADVQRAQSIQVPRVGFAIQYPDGTVTPVAPAPASTLLVKRGGNLVLDDLTPLNALPEGSGCTLPRGLRPLQSKGPEKPEPSPRWWIHGSLHQWLAGELQALPRTVQPPLIEQRVQIGTKPGSRQVAEGMLFTVGYRMWESQTHDGQMVRWVAQARVSIPSTLNVAPTGTTMGVFGGERRPVVVEWVTASPDKPDADHSAALAGARRVKMYLRSPGLFLGGWRPGWTDTLDLLEPELTKARLVGAAVGRPLTVSGWSYERETFGPKPTRWAAPAGSVYFFELERPLSSEAAARLADRRVCDQELDDGIGYGQALWGVWQ